MSETTLKISEMTPDSNLTGAEIFPFIRGGVEDNFITTLDNIKEYFSKDICKYRVLGDTDLNSFKSDGNNDVDYCLIGVQRNDGYCTDANHYPIRESGSLIVAGTIAGVTNQMYQTYNSHRLFIRGSSNASNEFSNWNEVLISHRIGSRGDYEQTIFLLCKVDVNENLYNRLSGKIYTQYDGVGRYYAADIDFWNSNWIGGVDYRFRLVKYGLVDANLVKCTYNGEQWYALAFQEDQAVIVYFQGSYENIDFTKIIYRNDRTGEIFNSEVYDSIQILETSVDKVNDTWYATEKYVDDAVAVVNGKIPTKTSQLTNDSGFATTSQIPSVPSNVSEFNNDAGYVNESRVNQLITSALAQYVKSSNIRTLVKMTAAEYASSSKDANTAYFVTD